MLAEESRVYVTKSVRELVFDGFSDNLLNIFQKLNRLPLPIIKINIPFDKFGWFYQVGWHLRVRFISAPNRISDIVTIEEYKRSGG